MRRENTGLLWMKVGQQKLEFRRRKLFHLVILENKNDLTISRVLMAA